jgi:hypothetical protein
VPIVFKSESLNLLESLRPVQACNGFALPFYFGIEKDLETRKPILEILL